MNHPHRSINGRNVPYHPVVRYVGSMAASRAKTSTFPVVHSAVGESAAITTKRGGNRTDVDDRRLRELECQRSLYLGDGDRPTVPEAALRAMIEAAARKTKRLCLAGRGEDPRLKTAGLVRPFR